MGKNWITTVMGWGTIAIMVLGQLGVIGPEEGLTLGQHIQAILVEVAGVLLIFSKDPNSN